MNSPEAARPRRWFQLHLLTCLVLMIVAGIVIGANMHAHLHGNLRPSNRWQLWFNWGWPADFAGANRTWDKEGAVERTCDEELEEGRRIAERVSLFGFDGQPVGPRIILWRGLFINLAYGAGLMLLIGVPLEWRLRRRERAQ